MVKELSSALDAYAEYMHTCMDTREMSAFAERQPYHLPSAPCIIEGYRASEFRNTFTLKKIIPDIIENRKSDLC